jgi:Na+-transporting methylmalonyl-CoA/oxaloacetate decarboxylase gamma subunit
MSIFEILLVSIFGIAVVFIVLVGLSLLVRAQTALYTRFTQKKPVATLVQDTPAATAPVLAEADDITSKQVSEDKITRHGNGQQGVINRAAGTIQSGYQGSAVRSIGGGEIKKKYVASVNGKVYEAEVEEVTAPPRQDTATTT